MSALTAFNRKKSIVNGVEPEKQRRQGRFTENIAALTALNWKNSCVNGIEPEKSNVNDIETEK